MTATRQARAVLSDAESKLRSLVAEAASSGDYESVHLIARWAKAVGELTSEASPKSAAEPRPSNSGATSRQRGKKKSSGRSGGYPKFFRSADSLIKVAWSKSSRSEYEHKSPWTVVEQLTSAMTIAGQKSDLISMDQILPLTANGEEVPSYQSYLCLAWLRSEELVRQHGRQGYSLAPGVNLERESKTKWSSLPKRN